MTVEPRLILEHSYPSWMLSNPAARAPVTDVVEPVGCSRFDPDRFSAERVAARPRYSFVPFGFCGGRQCPGFRYVQTS